MMKYKKADFNAGTPMSCWLRGEMLEEIKAHIYGVECRGLLKKYHIKADKDMIGFVSEHVAGFDDYPAGLQKVAADIIRVDLDPEFKV